VRAAKPYNEDHFALAEEQRNVVRLMSNESPYRPSERVVAAVVKAALEGNFYPGRAAELRDKLGAREGVCGDHVLLGAGSAELIDLAIRTFVSPGEEVVISVPTFSMYEARTRVVGGIPIMVPMAGDGELDVPALIAAITERTKVIFLCTPNNPTGTRIDESKLRRILRLGLPTVIDEAYCELSDDAESFAYLIAEFPNALVLRTFSKAWGLAGMRVGYALGHPEHMRLLMRVKVPWNMSALAIAAALAVLDDADEQAQRLSSLRAGRAYLERELGSIEGVRVMPSQANFVVVDAVGTGLGAQHIVDGLLSRGYFIRSLESHRAGGSLVRITVGDAMQNVGCVAAFRDVVALGAAKPSQTGVLAS
jgi:histidinol-phosphate aminotransferase